MQSVEEALEPVKVLFTITTFDQQGEVDFKALSENA